MTRTDTAMYVAIAAAALAALLAIVVVYLLVVVRRLRANQRLVVGGSTHDLVEYAVGLLARVEACEQRFTAVENSTGAAITRHRRLPPAPRTAALRRTGGVGRQAVGDDRGYRCCRFRGRAVGDPRARLRAHLHQGRARGRERRGAVTGRATRARDRGRRALERRSGRRGYGSCPRTHRVGGGGRRPRQRDCRPRPPVTPHVRAAAGGVCCTAGPRIGRDAVTVHGDADQYSRASDGARGGGSVYGEPMARFRLVPRIARVLRPVRPLGPESGGDLAAPARAARALSRSRRARR